LTKLSVLVAVLALVTGACGGTAATTTAAPVTTAAPQTTTAAPVETTTTAAPEPIVIGLVYDIGGRGDQSFNDSAAAGLDQAVTDFGIEALEQEPAAGGENREELLNLVSDEGAGLVFGVGFLFADSIGATAAAFPDVKYGLIDGFVADLTDASNIVALSFAEHEGSFLVGAAAGLKSTSKNIGFIGGVEIDLIKKFQAGFQAGVAQTCPDCTVDVKYISQPPDFSGFNDPAKGLEIGTSMYEAGADVVYHAAGGSGGGLFQAANDYSESSGGKVWAIGVDSDQYNTSAPEVRDYILTSMLKRVDVSVYDTIEAFLDGEFAGGYQTFGLADDGIGYATSGGFVDDIAAQLEDLKAMIISGEIEVPVAPA
jgi:basic membrane protein A